MDSLKQPRVSPAPELLQQALRPAEPTAGKAKPAEMPPVQHHEFCPRENTCGAVLDWKQGVKADVGLLPLSWECLGVWHMFLIPTRCTKKPAEVNV